MTQQVYIGIDQSLRGSAFAVTDFHGKVLNYKLVTTKNYTGAARLDYIESQYDIWLKPYVPYIECIGIEGYSVKSVNRPFDLGSVFGVLVMTSYRKIKKEPLVIPPTSVKLFCCGNTAEKDLIYSVNLRWGCNIEDDNIADSIAISQFVRAFDLNVYQMRHEREAVAGLFKKKAIKPTNIKSTIKGNI